MVRLISGLGSIHRVVPFREDRVTDYPGGEGCEAGISGMKEASLLASSCGSPSSVSRGRR